jgi:hypothetical protein
MTPAETIRTALAPLWDTGANAYELAQAVMKAADIESADLELEVESVIARALKARELIDLAKVAAEVAKLLPGEVESLPLYDAINAEIWGLMPVGSHLEAIRAITHAIDIIRNHFADLSAEEVARAMCVAEGVDPNALGYAVSAETKARLGDSYPLWKYRIPAAQAVMRLLRGE